MLPSFYKSKTIPPLALMDLTKERADGLPNLINAEQYNELAFAAQKVAQRKSKLL